MIESFAEDFEAHSEVCPLDVAECFSEGVCSIVAGQIDCSGPTLDHSIYCLEG